MAVTNNIREIREQRGIYQDALASAIGYSTKTVGRIERGDSTPSAEFMLRISKYFNMLVEDLRLPIMSFQQVPLAHKKHVLLKESFSHSQFHHQV